MQIDFSELEELLSPLTAMCKKEKTIDLGGVSVTLRPLTPTEETEFKRCCQTSTMRLICGRIR